jgi:hypothetical protein
MRMGVRARLEHRDDPGGTDAAAQAIDGAGDRRRVVRKIIVDTDAVDLAVQLQAPRDALECLQRIERLRHLHTHVPRGGDRRERVLHVVRADQRPVHGAARLPALQDLEAREVAHSVHRTRAPQRLRPCLARKTLERRPAPHLQRVPEKGVGGVPHDAPAPGHDAHQVVELALDGADVGVNVGVVILEVVENQGARTVVHKLRALVEERRVVLIRLDDEPPSGTEARAHPEVRRHATDEKPGVAAGVLEDPRQERCGRGLAMGAGDREHPAPFQHLARQPLRPRRIRQAALEQGFDHRLAARHDVADQHHVRGRRQLRGVEAFGQCDAE